MIPASDSVRVKPASVDWGWAKTGGPPAPDTRAAYLAWRADAAEEWFQKRPEDRASVKRRIGEFLQGCVVLLLDDHRPLADDDRAWLQDRCHKWMAKFDTQFVALEKGDDVAKIRGEMDAAVKLLVTALRERAKSPA